MYSWDRQHSRSLQPVTPPTPVSVSTLCAPCHLRIAPQSWFSSQSNDRGLFLRLLPRAEDSSTTVLSLFISVSPLPLPFTLSCCNPPAPPPHPAGSSSFPDFCLYELWCVDHSRWSVWVPAAAQSQGYCGNAAVVLRLYISRCGGGRGGGGGCIALHAYGHIYREMLNIMERVYTASC